MTSFKRSSDRSALTWFPPSPRSSAAIRSRRSAAEVDPCLPASYHQAICDQAVQQHGYWYGGTWYPHVYAMPPLYYYNGYRSYVASGGRVRVAVARHLSSALEREPRRPCRAPRSFAAASAASAARAASRELTMERIASTPRPTGRRRSKRAASSGTPARRRTGARTHTIDFTTDEIDTIERATNELHERCLEAVQHVIDESRYAELQDSRARDSAHRETWKEEPPSIYGRFDLAYDGKSPPVMLEYNADTPTSLLEASVIQWDWLEALHKGADQFNSIHERLVGVLARDDAVSRQRAVRSARSCTSRRWTTSKTA